MAGIGFRRGGGVVGLLGSSGVSKCLGRRYVVALCVSLMEAGLCGRLLALFAGLLPCMFCP